MKHREDLLKRLEAEDGDIPLPDFIDGPETEFDFFFWDEE